MISEELKNDLKIKCTFVMDDSIEYGVNMSKKIDELNHGSEHETL